jgi:hypothetical protein
MIIVSFDPVSNVRGNVAFTGGSHHKHHDDVSVGVSDTDGVSVSVTVGVSVSDSVSVAETVGVSDSERCCVKLGVGITDCVGDSLLVWDGSHDLVTTTVRENVRSLDPLLEGVTDVTGESDCEHDAETDDASEIDMDSVREFVGSLLKDSDFDLASADSDVELEDVMDIEREFVPDRSTLLDAVGVSWLLRVMVELASGDFVTAERVTERELVIVKEIVLDANSAESVKLKVGRSEAVMDASGDTDKRLLVRWDTDMVISSENVPGDCVKVTVDDSATVILLTEGDRVNVLVSIWGETEMLSVRV